MNKIIISLMLWMLVSPVQSGVMPSQSRVIFNASDRMQSLMLVNTNSYPVVVQTWADNGEGDPDVKNIPFIILPPVFRLETGDVRGIRIVKNETSLAQDRESLFWLNIYEMPPDTRMDKENSVLVTMNTQIKIIYRPALVTTTPAESLAKLRCALQIKGLLKCSNHSANYLSISSISYLDKENRVHSVKNGMLTFPPHAEVSIHENSMADSPARLVFTLIGDGGELTDISVNM